MISFGTFSYFLLSTLGSFVTNYFFSAKKKNAIFIFNVLFLVLTFYYAKKHLVLFVFCIVAFYFALQGLMASRKYRKLFGGVLICAACGLLGFFKYQVFQNIVTTLLPFSQMFLKPLVLLGVSFFTFKLIHIIVDVVSESIEEIDFVHFFNFLVFFPCLLSGPFDRYQRFKEDCETTERISSEECYSAVFRIVQGAFKKIVIANSLVVLTAFSMNPADLMSLGFWQIVVALYLYTIVLFFDFSGYSDMAIGISRLFGVKTPENFNRPYLATNVQEFWNRWHMSFISWLKDYLYFPISRALYSLGLRNFNVISPIGFFLTFVIAGIWHGDGWHFVFYGIYHGLGLSLYIVYRGVLKTRLSAETLEKYYENKFLKAFSIFITFNYVTFAWFFFLDLV